MQEPSSYTDGLIARWIQTEAESIAKAAKAEVARQKKEIQRLSKKLNDMQKSEAKHKETIKLERKAFEEFKKKELDKIKKLKDHAITTARKALHISKKIDTIQKMPVGHVVLQLGYVRTWEKTLKDLILKLHGEVKKATPQNRKGN